MRDKKFRHFVTSKRRKIRYSQVNSKKKLMVIFFHGFMSDMEGKKPKSFEKFSKKIQTGFLRFEYSGHGKSSNKLTEGNISKWTDDAYQLINSKINKKKVIFIGSSMGSWIALKLIPKFRKQMAGFIGIGSAPDFSDELMWKKFPRNIKDIINKKGIYNVKNEYGDPYPITKQFIKDGKKNKILKKFLNSFDLPVFLFHGNKDKSVPIKYSRKTLKLFKSDNKKLFVIKNGDHSLSRKKDLRMIQKNLKKLVNLQI